MFNLSIIFIINYIITIISNYFINYIFYFLQRCFQNIFRHFQLINFTRNLFDYISKFFESDSIVDQKNVAVAISRQAKASAVPMRWKCIGGLIASISTQAVRRDGMGPSFLIPFFFIKDGIRFEILGLYKKWDGTAIYRILSRLSSLVLIPK